MALLCIMQLLSALGHFLGQPPCHLTYKLVAAHLHHLVAVMHSKLQQQKNVKGFGEACGTMLQQLKSKLCLSERRL